MKKSQRHHLGEVEFLTSIDDSSIQAEIIGNHFFQVRDCLNKIRVLSDGYSSERVFYHSHNKSSTTMVVIYNGDMPNLNGKPASLNFIKINDSAIMYTDISAEMDGTLSKL